MRELLLLEVLPWLFSNDESWFMVAINCSTGAFYQHHHVTDRHLTCMERQTWHHKQPMSFQIGCPGRSRVIRGTQRPSNQICYLQTHEVHPLTRRSITRLMTHGVKCRSRLRPEKISCCQTFLLGLTFKLCWKESALRKCYTNGALISRTLACFLSPSNPSHLDE